MRRGHGRLPNLRLHRRGFRPRDTRRIDIADVLVQPEPCIEVLAKELAHLRLRVRGKQVQAHPRRADVVRFLQDQIAPVLESLARLAGGPERSRGLSPIQAVQELAAEGYIENEEAQRLRDMARLRSAVVHGDFSVNVTADQIEFLIKQLETLRVYISKVEDEERSH